MRSTHHANQINKSLDEAMLMVRASAEGQPLDLDDLLAKLAMAKSRDEKAATVVHLAEKFEYLVRTAPLDGCTAVVGRDLVRAIAAAKGIPSVLFHYQQMARDAQQAAA